MTTPTALFGRGGSVVYRNGRPRPLRYNEVRPRQRMVYATSTTGWAAVSNCSISTASVTLWDGTSETLFKVTASAASVNSFWDYTFPVTVAPGGKYVGFYIDVFVTRPTTSGTAGTGAAGCALTFFLYVGSLGSGNNIACTFEATWGWNRIFLCKEDFSAITGTGNWDTSTFMGIRGKITGTSGHTGSLWIREMGWI